MAALTDIDICSQALILLGEKPISSFEDGTDASQICSALYPQFKNMLLTVHKWRVTMSKRQLSRLSAAPINEWSYAYQLPSDLFSLKAVLNSLDTSPAEVTDFEIFGRELHTDEGTIVLEYQIETDEADWPPYLVRLAVYGFAAEIAPSVTDQVSAAEVWEFKAWGTPGERMQGGYFAVAKSIDSQGSPPQVIDNYTLVEVRN